MTDVGITVKGDIDFKRMMRELGTLKPFKTGLVSGGFHLKGRVARYPRASRRPQPFVSDKQRRGFFYHLNKGNIQVPYRRGISPGSERHGQSWTVGKRKDGFEVVAGSDTSYGPLMQDDKKQTGYHKGTGWKTVQKIAREARVEVSKVVLKAMNQAIKRLMVRRSRS